MGDHATNDTSLMAPVAPRRLRSKSYHTVMKNTRKSQIEKRERKSNVKEAFGKFLDDVNLEEEFNSRTGETRERHPPRRVKSANPGSGSPTQPIRREKKRREKNARCSNLAKSNGGFHSSYSDSNSGLRTFFAHEEKLNDHLVVADEQSHGVSKKSRSRVRNRRAPVKIGEDNSATPNASQKAHRKASAKTDDRRYQTTRRRSLGSMAHAGIGVGRSAVGSVTAGVDASTISSKKRPSIEVDDTRTISGDRVVDSTSISTDDVEDNLVDTAGVTRSKEESFLQERQSRQDEILGLAMNERSKLEEKKKLEDKGETHKREEEYGRFKTKRRPSLTGLRDARKRVQEKLTGATTSDGPNNGDEESGEEEAEEEKATRKREEENGRFKIKRRPSLTGLRDARKRVQEKLATAPSTDSQTKVGIERRGPKIVKPEDPSNESEEEDWKGDSDYNSSQLRDRRKSNLVDRVSNVVSTPEAKREVYRERRMHMNAPTVAAGTRVKTSNWDL